MNICSTAKTGVNDCNCQKLSHNKRSDVVMPTHRSLRVWTVRMMILTAGFLAMMLQTPMVRAQSAADCIAPQAQQLMNACAAREYQQADAALNTAWKSAKSFADAIGRGDALLQAQRAWLQYRDAACDVHASPFEGGSIQPLIRATCLAELTAQRTRMLLEFNAY